MPDFDWNGTWNKIFMVRTLEGIMAEFEKIPTISDLEKEEKKKVKHEGKILIMVDKNDPNKVIARDLVTGKTAEARCHKNDEFDFNTGAMIAFDRLMSDRVIHYWTGKVVCIKSAASRSLTVGKVYSVVNGKLLDNDNDDENPYVDGVKNLNDLNRIVYPFIEFIEYKGGAEE